MVYMPFSSHFQTLFLGFFVKLIDDLLVKPRRYRVPLGRSSARRFFIYQKLVFFCPFLVVIAAHHFVFSPPFCLYRKAMIFFGVVSSKSCGISFFSVFNPVSFSSGLQFFPVCFSPFFNSRYHNIFDVFRFSNSRGTDFAIREFWIEKFHILQFTALSALLQSQRTAHDSPCNWSARSWSASDGFGFVAAFSP